MFDAIGHMEMKAEMKTHKQHIKIQKTVGKNTGGARIAPRIMLCALIICLSIIMPVHQFAHASTTRIKDVVEIEGVRENMLVGYGLVVGLNGTGDSLNNSPFTRQSLIGMLERLGVSVKDQGVNTGNVAAVMVTATLPAFANTGSKMDINVSALGDASSLMGGTLLVTPLMGADGDVYAVAQGSVNISGFSAKGDAGSVTQNIPTAGRIPSGAIVEKEIGFQLADLKTVRLALRNPDFTTAHRISSTINTYLGLNAAKTDNNSSISLSVPPKYKGNIIDLLTEIEQLRVEPDQIARVVIDERSGVIVMGSDVRISTVAIAQGNLTIKINETAQVSQPNAFAEQGDTVVVPRTDLTVDDNGERKLAILDSGITLQDLVGSLNALGVGPRDIITILQAIKAAGALQAEIDAM